MRSEHEEDHDPTPQEEEHKAPSTRERLDRLEEAVARIMKHLGMT